MGQTVKAFGLQNLEMMIPTALLYRVDSVREPDQCHPVGWAYRPQAHHRSTEIKLNFKGLQ